MSQGTGKLVRTTRPLKKELIDTVSRLQPGQRIRITHTVRVGNLSWPATVEGTFRAMRSLVTGLATDRVPIDQVIVPTIHFTKDNGELSSVTLDENSMVEILA